MVAHWEGEIARLVLDFLLCVWLICSLSPKGYSMGTSLLLIEIRWVAYRLSFTSPWPELCHRTTLKSKECLELVFYSVSDSLFPYLNGEVQWTFPYGCEDPARECQESISLSTRSMGDAQDKLSKPEAPKDPKRESHWNEIHMWLQKFVEEKCVYIFFTLIKLNFIF